MSAPDMDRVEWVTLRGWTVLYTLAIEGTTVRSSFKGNRHLMELEVRGALGSGVFSHAEIQDSVQTRTVPIGSADDSWRPLNYDLTHKIHGSARAAAAAYRQEVAKREASIVTKAKEDALLFRWSLDGCPEERLPL